MNYNLLCDYSLLMIMRQLIRSSPPRLNELLRHKLASSQNLQFFLDYDFCEDCNHRFLHGLLSSVVAQVQAEHAYLSRI